MTIATAIAPSTASDAIVIRRANPADAAQLERLARLDSSTVPAGDLLVAEAGGELRAALRVADGAAVADPFHPTNDLVAQLELRAAHLRPEGPDVRDRLRTRVALWSELWWRAKQMHSTP